MVASCQIPESRRGEGREREEGRGGEEKRREERRRKHFPSQVVYIYVKAKLDLFTESIKIPSISLNNSESTIAVRLRSPFVRSTGLPRGIAERRSYV